MPQATLPDSTTIDLTVDGDGPTILLTADEAGKDAYVDGLAGAFRVVAFDFTVHAMAHPKPDTLTPDVLAADLLAIADAVDADRFAYAGYSWLALAGLQLALRTDRLDALVMGGFPPIDGPYAEMLAVTDATHKLSMQPPNPDPKPVQTTEDGEIDWSTVEVTMSEPVTRQFVTMYEALRGFDDRAVQAKLTCPRLCFVGSEDRIVYDERWGGVTVDIAGPVLAHTDELRELGWDVEILDGLDHLGAMRPDAVLPFLEPWLRKAFTGR